MVSRRSRPHHAYKRYWIYNTFCPTRQQGSVERGTRGWSGHCSRCVIGTRPIGQMLVHDRRRNNFLKGKIYDIVISEALHKRQLTVLVLTPPCWYLTGPSPQVRPLSDAKMSARRGWRFAGGGEGGKNNYDTEMQNLLDLPETHEGLKTTNTNTNTNNTTTTNNNNKKR